MDERGADRRENVQQEPREPAPDSAQLDERRREQDDERLHEHVASAHVRELVSDRGLELLAAERAECTERDRERRARRATPDGEESREAVVDQVQRWGSHAELGRDLVGSRT